MSPSTPQSATSTVEVDSVVTLNDVSVHYPVKEGLLQRVSGYVRAVDGVDLTIPRGQTLGLVGESGCGKTTLGRVVAGLVPATGGDIWFGLSAQQHAHMNRIRQIEPSERSAEDRALWSALEANHRLGSLSKQRYRDYRRNCQVVFQDSFASLNPRQLVRDIVGRPLRVHGEVTGTDVDQRVIELLERVGLGPQHLLRYPHQFSGGQRQRISIARALALNPEFVILDEPTSALDVSVQAQILNLLVDLQRDLGLTYLFITHDLGVVQHMADQIAVMYLGQIAEHGPTDQVFFDPLHPYSRILRDSNPSLEDEEAVERWELSGTVPNPINPPRGCRLHPRCPVATEACGWSVTDALDHIESLAPAVFESIDSVARSSDFAATIAMGSDDDAHSFAAQLNAAPFHSSMTAPAITNGKVVSLSFVEVDDAQLLPIRDLRSSACLRTQHEGFLPRQ